MPFDAGPGELDQAGAAIAVAEDPVVVPELAGLAEVPAGDPAFRLVRVAPCGPLAGEFPHVVVQRGVQQARADHAALRVPSPVGANLLPASNTPAFSQPRIMSLAGNDPIAA